MRTGPSGLAGAAALICVAVAAIDGCGSFGSGSIGGSGGASARGGSVGSGGSSASGGAVGTGGGSPGSGGASSCTNVTACGGSLTGTWTVSSSCLNVSGQLDLSLVGAGCATAPVTGSFQVSGTWTASANGTYTDNTVTTGQEQFTLAPSCLVISSTPVTCDGAAGIIQALGYSTVTCTSAAGGGCACSATINQMGGLGVLSVAAATGGYVTTSGNVMTLSGGVGTTDYGFCVAGTKLTVTPQGTSPAMTGTIVLQTSGGSGTGGVLGTGGAAGSRGTGGGAGGQPGSGGTRATGGTGGAAGGQATGGATGTGGGAAGSSGSATGPCDIYKTGGTPCVAAHSTVRALFGAYGGKLYQVRNAAGTTKDINAVAPGGVADGAAQDAFCSGTTCVITIVYDQSGKGNDLWYQGSGSPAGGKDQPASATGESIKVGGNKVYSLYIKPSNSYWVDGSKQGLPLGSAPEGMYMVTSGTHFNSGCCFDYGNSESDRKADGAGAMDALNLSNTTAWGTGAGSGPWVMADLEYGLFSEGTGNGKNNSDPTQTAAFVTAVLRNNGTTEWALRGGDATTGALTTYYKGALPGGWSPMKKQGAIVLGSGGDCCATNNNLSQGTFYEGCIVSGYPTDATENAVQANIVAAGYSK